MAKLYQANDYCNGAFSIVNHPVKGIGTKGGKALSSFGTMTADDADKAVSKVIEHADSLGVPLDKWSVYIAGVNEKLTKEVKHLPVAALKKAVKAGWVATVEMGKFSHPRLTLRDPAGDTKSPRTSISEVLA